MRWHRRPMGWLAVLCVLWHAAYAVHHHVVALDPTAVPRAAHAAIGEAGLLRDVMLALCRPAIPDAGGEPAGGPTGPSPDGKAGCPDCCLSAPVALTGPMRSLHPALEQVPLRVAWQAIHATIAERTAERPPVRGPPLG